MRYFGGYPRRGLSVIGNRSTEPTRKDYLERLHATVVAGTSIVGAGVGTGISAECAEAGGADLIIIYTPPRPDGGHGRAGLLAYGDANAIVVSMAREVRPVVKNIPVLAGVNGPTLSGVCRGFSKS